MTARPPGLDGAADFVRVAGGVFEMGAQADAPAAPGYDPDASPSEGPVRQVTLPAFAIQRDEASTAQFAACVAAGACRPESVLARDGLSTAMQAPHPAVPVNTLTWEGARALCAWMGGRLPTEAEWEYAASHGDGRRYPWGDDERCAVLPHSRAVQEGTEGGVDTMAACTRFIARLQTEVPVEVMESLGPLVEAADRAAVGSVCQAVEAMPMERAVAEARRRLQALPKVAQVCDTTRAMMATDLQDGHPLGLRGMAGNVAEWVADTVDGPSGAPRSPGHELHVLRGGSFLAVSPAELRTTARAWMPADQQIADVGVRCARDEAP